MANMAKVGKEWNRKQDTFLLKLIKSLRSRLTWRELLIGFLASVVFAAILSGYREQVIPEFKIGEFSNQNIRAFKDVHYVDEDATAKKRAEARASIPPIYELDINSIDEVKESLQNIFEVARTFIESKSIPATGNLRKKEEQEMLEALKLLTANTVPDEVMRTLLRERFSQTVENKILKVLDTVLHEGIIEDPQRFANELKMGITTRDSSFPFEHQLSDTSFVRGLPEAKDYLRQLDLDLPKWSVKEKDALVRYMDTMLVPTLVYNEQETEARREMAASQVPTVEVQIKRYQTVVQYGERITPDRLNQLNAMRNQRKPSSLILRGLAFFLFSIFLLYVLWRYLVSSKSRHSLIRKHATLILVIITAELIITRLASNLAGILDERFHWFQDPSGLYYAIPFALGPLLVALLTDGNLGIMVSIILATLIGLFYGDMNIAVYVIMGSLAGIYSIRQYKDRAAILKAGVIIGLLNCVCLAGLYILQQNPVSLIAGLELAALAFISGLLASTIASIMLPALEYFFKIVTDIRLLELSNLNDPILRRLSVEAPGTYHHSLMVATLAENAAEAINANPFLARVSAYYHDIGKIVKPEYFVENQSMDYNKHEQISPRMSSLVLSSHVKEGLQLAKEIRLPQKIREMIPQHHGTRMMTYFFHKAKESADYKSGSFSDADFRYSGPKPQSREAAIMMMADSVEAASRTISGHNPSQIRGMIDRLVDEIVSDGQFDECDITLRDIRLVKESLFKILTGLYHRRIDYPNYDFKHNDKKEGDTKQNSDPKQATIL